MAIDPIPLYGYPLDNSQSIFSKEEYTALELAGKTANKMNEVVQVANGIEQNAIESRQIVDNMQLEQENFVIENSNIRDQILADNGEFIADLTASKETFEDTLAQDITSFKSDLNTSKTVFEEGLNTSKETFETNMTEAVNDIISSADSTINTSVETKIDTLVNDGTIDNLINTQILGDVKEDIILNEKSINDISGVGVVSGLLVLAQSSPEMSVLVSQGIAHLYNGKRYTQNINQSVIIEPADILYSRIDIIYINSDGLLSYGKGEASADPIAPGPLNALILAEVLIDVGTNSITTNNITNMQSIKKSIPELDTEIQSFINQTDLNFNDVNSQLADIGYIEKTFGIVGDGVTNDSEGIQAYADYCLKNRCKMKLSHKKYLCNTPIYIRNIEGEASWSIFELEGELSGSATTLVQSDNPGTTIITNGNSAFVFEFYNYFNTNVKTKHISFRNIGEKGTTKAIHYKFNNISYPIKQYLHDVNVNNFNVGIEFEGLSDIFEHNYFGTTIIESYNAYQCDIPIHFNNSFANLIEIKNSLFHVATNGGLKFSGSHGGGMINISSSHFEGCEPAAIVPFTRVTTFSLHNVTAETCGVTSGKGMFDLASANTTTNIRIDGYYLSAIMPEFELTKNCSLRVSGSSVVNIKSKGGVVYTPNNVKISANDDDYSFVFYPYDGQGNPTRNNAIARFSGHTSLQNPSFNSEVPANLLNDFAFINNSTIFEHRVSMGTSTDKRWLVASWLFETTGSVGFIAGSQIIYDSTIINFISSFVQVNLGIPLVGVLVVPVKANSDVIALKISLNSLKYSTPAYVSLEPYTRNMTLSAIGQPKNVSMNDTVTIEVGSNFTFRDVGSSGNPYAIAGSLLLNGGVDGFIDYKFYGKTTNGAKYVDTVGESKNEDIVVVATDGIANDLYNVSVTNNSTLPIMASMKIKYRS